MPGTPQIVEVDTIQEGLVPEILGLVLSKAQEQMQRPRLLQAWKGKPKLQYL
jgi:hypothetical protein